jgi:hypothetical protein
MNVKMENGRVLEKRFSVSTVSVLPDKARASVSSFKVSAVTVPVWSVLPNNSLKTARNTPFILSRTINILSGEEI